MNRRNFVTSLGSLIIAPQIIIPKLDDHFRWKGPIAPQFFFEFFWSDGGQMTFEGNILQGWALSKKLGARHSGVIGLCTMKPLDRNLNSKRFPWVLL